MIDSEQALETLQLINETLTATIVIVSVSILLYTLARNTQDRVTRTSSIVLLCVIITYVTDVIISLEPGQGYLETWLRYQWLGIAFVPAALVHLSDALLATTGRPSRGRRRFVVRLSYAISGTIAFLAITSNLIIDAPRTAGIPHMTRGPAFPIYLTYLIVIDVFATINVIRARRRCLTRYTQRRMTYLLTVFLTPLWGTFPYSLLGSLSEDREIALLVILNLANLVVMVMLVFMAYPLSFFGTEKPDRIIKAQLLEFMLRGPLTGTAILGVILFVPGVSNVLGLDGDTFMPFAAVAVVLLLQWTITLSLPVFQRWLIYPHDQRQTDWIQRIEERLLTQDDASQLLESILAAICDNLRVPTAFVATLEPHGAQIVQVVGSLTPSPKALSDPKLSVLAQATQTSDQAISEQSGLEHVGTMFLWHSYWLVPLRYNHPAGNGIHPPLLGVLGVWARAPEPNLDEDEQHTFQTLTRQAARVLEDVQRQSEVFVILEGLASRMNMTQHQLRSVSRYGHVSAVSPTAAEDITANPEFAEMVRDALRDYWGGPRLTESELLKLNIVWREMEETDDKNPVRALRNILAQAIENLRPEGERSLTTTEWILYNILEMRFLQGRKVRDVALRLAMSHADLYRKQRIAIEEVAKRIEEMERGTMAENKHESPPSP